jgi:hypothetical protein
VSGGMPTSMQGMCLRCEGRLLTNVVTEHSVAGRGLSTVHDAILVEQLRAVEYPTAAYTCTQHTGTQSAKSTWPRR